jgi:hypothetical protein
MDSLHSSETNSSIFTRLTRRLSADRTCARTEQGYKKKSNDPSNESIWERGRPLTPRTNSKIDSRASSPLSTTPMP